MVIASDHGDSQVFPSALPFPAGTSRAIRAEINKLSSLKSYIRELKDELRKQKSYLRKLLCKRRTKRRSVGEITTVDALAAENEILGTLADIAAVTIEVDEMTKSKESRQTRIRTMKQQLYRDVCIFVMDVMREMISLENDDGERGTSDVTTIDFAFDSVSSDDSFSDYFDNNDAGAL